MSRNNDNLILTLLGGVGLCALVMSLNKKDEIRENFWNAIQFTSQEIDASDPVTIKGGLQQLQKVGNQQLMQQMQQLQQVSIGGEKPMAEKKESVERFTYDSHYQPTLGSAQVTNYDYVSYPGFQQSVSAPSPSLNLPAQIRYNPPSLNTMGVTENFVPPRQMSNMDYAGVVENYMSTDSNNPSPPSGYAAGNYDQAVNEAAEASKLPIGSMEAGQGAAPENVMMFDRYMIVPGKSAGRFNRGNGIVDRIRGDLPICVDPCQKGWFQSPGNPSQLTVGALGVIGGSGDQANAISNFTKLYGANTPILPSSGRGNPQLQMLQQVSPSSGTNEVKVTGFN